MKIGPTFYNELLAAGLGELPMAWECESGEITFREDVTDKQRKAVSLTFAAHDPAATLPTRTIEV